MSEFERFFEFLKTTPLYYYGRMALYGLLIASWVGVVLYALHDSERRFKRPWARGLVILLPLLGWLPGFIIYLFLRPSETVTDRMYQQFLTNTVKLQENPSMCPSCRGFVKADFIHCPHCGNQVLVGCHTCGRSMRRDWRHCPSCCNNQT